jgi:hypothetical protein
MANAADLSEVLEWQGNAQLVVHLPTGDLDCGYFQKLVGADKIDSDEAKWGSGGMSTDVARGGRPTRDNATLTRAYSPTRDGPIFNACEPYRGRVRATVTDFVLDLDGNVLESKAHQGMLKALDRGEYDDTSNSQRTFTVEVSTDA